MAAKSTTIKRIRESISHINHNTPTKHHVTVKEAAEITSNPTPDLHAAPLEENLFEWHFTIRGPPAPSAFANGVYHGRIILPPAYPLRPPSFRFLTPSGRFEPNREICLSISGHHEETWQPAWGVRTALVAIRSFMDTDAGGQVGGMSAPDSLRKQLAEKSREYSCAACGKAALAILEEQEERCKEMGCVAPSHDQENALLGKITLVEPKKKDSATAPASSSAQTPADTAPPTTQQSQPPPQIPVQEQQQQPPLQLQRQDTPMIDAWIDKAIIGIVIALVLMILRRIA
jgi:ubiquitin-conjugating enzyme E2 J1